MTILSHAHRFVFIAVPKTGSHSIRFALRDQLGPEDEEQVSLFVERRIHYPPFTSQGHGHQLARDVRQAMGTPRWVEYLSFAVVRNPWERFVSYVAFFMRNNPQFKSDPRGVMHRVLSNPQNQSPIHFRPQSDYLTDPEGGLIVSRVCRSETLQADFDGVCEVLGLERRVLEARNASNHLRYTEYFDDDLIRLVAARYRDDVERFGYSFGA